MPITEIPIIANVKIAFLTALNNLVTWSRRATTVLPIESPVKGGNNAALAASAPAYEPALAVKFCTNCS